MAFQKNTTSITRADLQTKLSANAADINTWYVISDAVGSTKVIQVQAASVSALRGTAENFTDSTFGVYDIGADTFVAQGGVTYPINATGAINETSATLASASTVNIGAAAANAISITGTTTITAFDTIQAGTVRTLTFAGALTLTYNATSLILPTAANISTAAGDVMVIQSLGSGNWKCIGYTRANGKSLFPFIESVTGLTVDNTDPVNPVVKPVYSFFNGVPGASENVAAGYIVGRSRVIDYNTQIQYLYVSGTTTAVWEVWPYKKYVALLTQHGSYDPQSAISGTLTVGVSYEITNYQAGDDFTNVGADSNATGVKFVATGTKPAVWSNSSELSWNGGAPIAIELENNIGIITWSVDFFVPGTYYANSSSLFTIGKTAFLIQPLSGESDNGFCIDNVGVKGIDTIGIKTVGAAGMEVDGLLSGTMIEIRVYP